MENAMKVLLTTLLMAGFATAGCAETISGLCMVSASHDKDAAEIVFRSSDCGDHGNNCSMSNDSDIAWSRWTGVSSEALKQEGAQLIAHMNGEPGDLQCSGTVHDGILSGRYEFTPHAAFVQKMASMGFNEITPRKQEGFLMLDITTLWVQQMKDAGVTELTTNKLMGLKALHVDRDYIRGMSEAGYPELRAGKLTEMKAVGVTPEKAREAKALGFQPTEQELIQMSIFKVDRPFVERMRARGLTNLTLDKLIKVKIFKLED
jgi:hypothetical protein